MTRTVKVKVIWPFALGSWSSFRTASQWLKWKAVFCCHVGELQASETTLRKRNLSLSDLLLPSIHLLPFHPQISHIKWNFFLNWSPRYRSSLCLLGLELAIKISDLSSLIVDHKTLLSKAVLTQSTKNVHTWTKKYPMNRQDFMGNPN